MFPSQQNHSSEQEFCGLGAIFAGLAFLNLVVDLKVLSRRMSCLMVPVPVISRIGGSLELTS